MLRRSMRYKNLPSTFWPEEEGETFKLKESLEPLEPFREYVTIVSNTDTRNAEPVSIWQSVQ